MIINGEIYKTLAVFPSMMTVPDCFVTEKNKLGDGHGEAKLYIKSKKDMYSFYGGEGFTAKCFMLKSDLVAYMNAVKNEYFEPSQDYSGKEEFTSLWDQRMKMINALDDVVFFHVKDQKQISGSRGYVKSTDDGYKIIRKIALPLVSYIYVEKVGTETAPLYYWKLFVDFNAILEKRNGPLVFTYGKLNKQEKNSITPRENDSEEKLKNIRQSREGQGKYREQLLEQCPFCPVTMISDDRLLIASHIKPWAASNEKEKIDPYNGYMLSPMIDKLFDKGFITFTSNKHLVLSKFISNRTWKQIGLKDETFINALPMDEKRIKYLEFHHQSVFKGSYQE